MASFPTEPASRTSFALAELIACWNQGYEALARGDLDAIGDLLDHTDDLLRDLPEATQDGPAERELREQASLARGRLEHGMRAGLDGLAEELGRVRQGARTLRGYRPADGVSPEHVHRTA
ncbi:MAG: hypothetical protein JNK49_18325 [Planctomycetes bacterium]|nr:hypothetical protein [Planctomycetota bacterium]